MKLIFLDFDGVLNSHKFLCSDYFRETTRGLTDAQLYLVKYEYMLDPEAVKLINDLIVRSEAQVVISSSHRNRYSLEEINQMLQGRGANFQVIAKTPRGIPRKFSLPVDRGDEIQELLDIFNQEGKSVESFVILDNHSDMRHLRKYLVLTSDLVGITLENVEEALKILNGDVK